MNSSQSLFNYNQSNRKYDTNFLRKIAIIFVELDFKLYSNAYFDRGTSVISSLFILNKKSRKVLFLKILNEIKLIFITLFQLELPLSILYAKKFFLKRSINKVILNFFSPIFNTKELTTLLENYSKLYVLNELDLILWEDLCYFFLFNTFTFKFQAQKQFYFSDQFFFEQAIILLENCIIKISSTISSIILDSLDSIKDNSNIFTIVEPYYLVPRHLRYLKNNLLLFDLLNYYIYSPKLIYENKYLILNLNQKRILSYYISCYRNQEILFLSNSQLLLIVLLEVKDLFLPKIENSIYLIGKMIIYIFTYFIGTITKIILQNIRDIIRYFDLFNSRN